MAPKNNAHKSASDLAKTLSDGPQASAVPVKPVLSYGRGQISTTLGGGKVTLYLNGAMNATSAERLANAGTLSAGEYVECLIFGTRVIVIGPVGG